MTRLVPLLLLAGCLPPPERPVDRLPPGATAVPPGNVRITLELFEFDARDAAVVDVALRYRDPAVDVSAGRLGGPNGLILFAGAGDFRAAFRAESARFRSRRTTMQSILVADGAEGLLQVVDHVPAAFDVPVHGGRPVRGVLTGAGLAVRPRGRDDGAVDVELVPWFQVQRGPTLRTTEIATRVTVPPGRPIVLATREEASESVATALLAARSGRGHRRTIAVLLAER